MRRRDRHTVGCSTFFEKIVWIDRRNIEVNAAINPDRLNSISVADETTTPTTMGTRVSSIFHE
jgi:hypothetical protein